MLGAVREPEIAAAQAVGAQHRVVRNRTERKNNARLRALRQFRLQIRDCTPGSPSGSGLFCGGRHLTEFVIRARRSIRSVIRADRHRASSPDRTCSSVGVEQDTGEIAGERAPRAIRSVHPRREADDQQRGLRVAERRYGLAEIVRAPRAAPNREKPPSARSAGSRDRKCCSCREDRVGADRATLPGLGGTRKNGLRGASA